MIAYIKGKLAHKEPTFVIIDVNGIGYHIKISLNTYSSLADSESCMLHTYLHIKENAHTLFGFSNEDEKKTFLALTSVAGIGPAIGMVILSSLSVDEIAEAIVSEDVKTIQSVKGIGAKTAQRAILELKDKFKKEGIVEKTNTSTSKISNTAKVEALSALTTLGFTKQAAEKSIEQILKQYGQELSLEELIKLSLRSS